MKMILFTLIFISSITTQAGLGEKVSKNFKNSSIQVRSQSLSDQSKYFVNEYVNSDGISIKEFYNQSDIVFAVTWEGFSHPDLENLLGQYWSQYESAPNRQGHRKDPVLQVKTGDMVVEKSGKMRMVFGRAYLPSLIPTGVSINEIK